MSGSDRLGSLAPSALPGFSPSHKKVGILTLPHGENSETFLSPEWKLRNRGVYHLQSN